MKVYTIYDKKAKLGMQLFCAENFDVAKRILMSSLDEKSTLVQYPGDYLLKELGIYDTDKCVLSGHTDDLTICEVKSLIPDSLKRYCLDGAFNVE